MALLPQYSIDFRQHLLPVHRFADEAVHREPNGIALFVQIVNTGFSSVDVFHQDHVQLFETRVLAELACHRLHIWFGGREDVYRGLH